MPEAEDQERTVEEIQEALDSYQVTEEQQDRGEELAEKKSTGSGSGSVVVKPQLCGKYCNGCPHGPYAWLVSDEGWTYLGDVGSTTGTGDELIDTGSETSDRLAPTFDGDPSEGLLDVGEFAIEFAGDRFEWEKTDDPHIVISEQGVDDIPNIRDRPDIKILSSGPKGRLSIKSDYKHKDNIKSAEWDKTEYEFNGSQWKINENRESVREMVTTLVKTEGAVEVDKRIIEKFY